MMKIPLILTLIICTGLVICENIELCTCNAVHDADNICTSYPLETCIAAGHPGARKGVKLEKKDGKVTAVVYKLVNGLCGSYVGSYDFFCNKCYHDSNFYFKCPSRSSSTSIIIAVLALFAFIICCAVMIFAAVVLSLIIGFGIMTGFFAMAWRYFKRPKNDPSSPFMNISEGSRGNDNFLEEMQGDDAFSLP